MKALRSIWLFIFISVMLMILLLSSCSVEMKLGKEFRENWNDTVVLLFTPDYVFKNNLKTYLVPDLDSMPEAVQDSILIEYSLFLKDIADSTVISGFENAFKERLVQSGFKVLEESDLDKFLVEQRRGILVNFAQISLEEFVHPYSFDYEMSGEYLTVSDIDLNAVSFNLWLEVSQLNSENHHKVLFASDFTTDQVEGYFRQFIFSGEVKFEYSIDTLTVPQIYTFVDGLGKKYADYLYDYFLNNYIRENVPEDYPVELRNIHWNPESRIFQMNDRSGRFIELETEE